MSLVLPITRRIISNNSLLNLNLYHLIPLLNTFSNNKLSIITINSNSSSTSSSLLLTSSTSSIINSSSLLSLLPFSFPSISSIFPEETLNNLRELLPPWVLAVPKSKTTHSAKSMRSANKGLKEQQNIVACPSCGTPKRAHHLCHDCHVDHRREYHARAKEEIAAEAKELTLQQ